ncbi:MAG: CbtA family protein [Solirubrobacteraceae bacterium]|nr:CbtA family protein [Solirubrobacteraceae bacterium]
MVWTLIRRGLVVGVIAGLLAGLFAFVFGEPLVQDAIDIEEAASAHASLASLPLAHISDWAVGRPEQRGGLLLATALYGAAAGGLFAIAFAVLRGRGAQRSDWELATRLAGVIFVALVLVPWIKYPPNPPAVGDPGTIGDRTAYYVILLVGAALAMLAAARVVWSLRPEAPPWVRPLAGAGTFIAVAGGLALALPGFQEIPADFPAPLIWEFRLSSLGTQAVLWASLGIGYGIAMWRAAASKASAAIVREAA